MARAKKAATKNTATKNTATKNAATKNAATKNAATKNAATKNAATKKAATKKAATKNAATKRAAKVVSRGASRARARALREAVDEGPTSDASLWALDARFEVRPDMPIPIALRELRKLAAFGEANARVFDKLGLGPELALLRRFGARLQALQAAWLAARQVVARSGAERRLLAEAVALDAKLVAGGRWACRDDGDAQAALDRIAAGSGPEGTLEALRDGLKFWHSHAARRGFTDITDEDLERAEALLPQLEGVVEKETADRDATLARALRNRCYWAADKLAKTIREGGRYAFRQYPAIVAKLTSRHRAAIQRRSRRLARTKKTAAPTRPDGAPTPPNDA
jgi:hypothetical protein